LEESLIANSAYYNFIKGDCESFHHDIHHLRRLPFPRAALLVTPPPRTPQPPSFPSAEQNTRHFRHILSCTYPRLSPSSRTLVYPEGPSNMGNSKPHTEYGGEDGFCSPLTILFPNQPIRICNSLHRRRKCEPMKFALFALRRFGRVTALHLSPQTIRTRLTSCDVAESSFKVHLHATIPSLFFAVGRSTLKEVKT
jgi:hypothetical protein